MKKFILIVLGFGFSVVSSYTSAAFTCEQIKDKKTRASCIEDRAEKEKTDTEEKEKAIAAEKEKAIEAEKRKGLDEFVRKSKEALTKSYKDPASAQFTELVISKGYSQQALCGYVNGKNSYGAYAGRKMFTVLWLDSSPSAPSIWVEDEPEIEGQGDSTNREWALTVMCKPSSSNTITKIDSSIK